MLDGHTRLDEPIWIRPHRSNGLPPGFGNLEADHRIAETLLEKRIPSPRRLFSLAGHAALCKSYSFICDWTPDLEVVLKRANNVRYQSMYRR